ncbi:hypothetical protein WN55_01380 [Dufourea novaeangliae]|uniref:Agrin n=1 Tax=Dufourea novaeangliae TaxID=178035 RepID=A0A154PFN8_DUFNO|nr:hypothetical protein WN55_01380 [Dufourea novaeangliae]
MDISMKISFIVVWASFMLPMAVSSTKELLDCRANLTADIRNDTTFLSKVRQADYIFTGKIKELRNGQLHVRVKRAIKGVLNATLDLTANDTCGRYIRRSYTGIFMARRDTGFGDLRHVDKIVMHFGPVPLTLANLDRLNAAVRGEGLTLASFRSGILARKNEPIGSSNNLIGEAVIQQLVGILIFQCDQSIPFRPTNSSNRILPSASTLDSRAGNIQDSRVYNMNTLRHFIKKQTA